MGKHGPTARPVAERFWPKVDKTGGPDACWPWTGCVNRTDGCGWMWGGPGRPMLRAHRVAWELAHGTITNDDIVVKCTANRLCCNPAHMTRRPRRAA